MRDNPRILVSLPCYGGIIFDRFLSSWTQLMEWANKQQITLSLQIISNESLLPRARNLGVAKALEHEDAFTHVLFVDADMGFSPWRLERLLRWDKDFAGAPGPAKFIHWDLVSKAVWAGQDPQSFSLRYCVNFFQEGTVDTEDGFAKVKDLGCCFFLCKIPALRRMADHYPDLKCNSMSFVNGQPYSEAETYMFFDTMKTGDGRYLECDHAFMARFRDMGGDVWADLTADLTHVGTYHFQGDMALYFFGKQIGGGHVRAFDTPWGTQIDGEQIPRDDSPAQGGQLPEMLQGDGATGPVGNPGPGA